MSRLEYSIVIPVFRSGHTLIELFEQIQSVFNTVGADFQVVFVDDAGGDDSWEIISTLAKEHPETVVAVQLPENRGQHFATVFGFRYCKGDLILTVDDDLQIAPGEIPKLIGRQQDTGADVVYGTYARKVNNPLARICRRTAVKLLRTIFNAEEFGSSFRLLTREMAEEVLLFSEKGILLDAIIMVKAGNVAFQEVSCSMTLSRSRYSFVALAGLFFRLLTGYFAMRTLSERKLPAFSVSKKFQT